MKKRVIIALTMALIVAASVVTVCLVPSDGGEQRTTTSSTSTTVAGPTKQVVVTTKKITTDSAKVKEVDAITLIEGLSAEKLGISSKDKERCSFMVASNGEKIDGKYYVKVIAAIKSPKTDADGNTLYTFNTKGEYYISYDGCTVLSMDIRTGDYTPIDIED